MKVLIRTDASTEIGSGHVMRCLTIAEKLRSRNCNVSFFMKRLSGNLIAYVQSRGFKVIDHFQTVDLCIIDHYEIDERWEQTIRPFVRKIVVIDDLANRQHDCDLIIDPNVVPNFATRYDSLVPETCVKLLGPKNLIIREEFIQERQRQRWRDGTVDQLLIFMGGTDPTNETIKVLQALQKVNSEFSHVDVVVGNGNTKSEKIKEICRVIGYHFHQQINYMAFLMRQADFSIGAGGSTTWERCYVGLPSSNTIVAENQISATEMAANLGVAWNIGWHEDVTVQTYEQLLQRLPFHKDEIKQMSERGLKLAENRDGPNPWFEKILELMQE